MKVNVCGKVFDTENSEPLMGAFYEGDSGTLYSSKHGYFMHYEYSEGDEAIELISEKEAQEMLAPEFHIGMMPPQQN